MSINFQHEAPCPIASLLELMGERWSFLIIRDAFYGVRRFDGFQQHLGISKKVLSQRLHKLVETGILQKELYQQRPDRHEYRLTAKGQDLFPVLMTMMRWGNRWLVKDEQKTVELQHKDCCEKAEPRLVCSVCGKPMTPGRVQAVPGPGVSRDVVQEFRKIIRKSEYKPDV